MMRKINSPNCEICGVVEDERGMKVMQLIRWYLIFVNLKAYTIQFKPSEITVCYDNSSNFGRSNNVPRVVDVTIGSTVHIWCHYCKAKEDYYSKLWFYRPRGRHFIKRKMIEIQPNDSNLNKVSITLSHTLNFDYFTPNQSGVYTCKSYEKTQHGNIFTYVLDGVIYVDDSPKVGGVNQWQDYKRTYLDTMNKKLRMSPEEPYSSFRNNYNIILNVYMIWENWSECKDTDGHQKSVRKRRGRCRISPAFLAKNRTLNLVTSYLTDGYDVPCRSLKLNDSVPDISRILRNIPEFEAEEVCLSFGRTVYNKAFKDKSKHKSIQVMENSHLTLKCNEIIPDTDLKWFKNKKLLKSLYGNIINRREEEEPHMSIDANNSLHILHISKNEEGNYTCSMNGKKVKQFEVKVVSKSKLLNQEFIRYSIYLGFVLSLTMTCYCAGVCVAWHRRASFADPLNLYKKKPYLSRSKCEEEKLID